MRLGLAILNIIELALLRPIEDCDCDIVLLRGREAGAVEAFPFVSSFMLATDTLYFPHWRPRRCDPLSPLDTRDWTLGSGSGHWTAGGSHWSPQRTLSARPGDDRTNLLLTGIPGPIIPHAINSTST